MTDLPITTYFVLSRHAAPASWALPVETKRVQAFAFDADRMPLRTMGHGALTQTKTARRCTLVLNGQHPDLQEAVIAGLSYQSATILSFRELTRPPVLQYRFRTLTPTSLVVLPPEKGSMEGSTTTVELDFASLEVKYGGPSNP